VPSASCRFGESSTVFFEIPAVLGKATSPSLAVKTQQNNAFRCIFDFEFIIFISVHIRVGIMKIF
jgi:hypothetical protein